MKRLNTPEVYEKIKEGLGISMDDRGGPNAALISSFPNDDSLVGLTIAQVSEMREQDPLDCALGLLREHMEGVLADKIKGGFSIVNFNQSEENIEKIMKQPWVAFGTDGRVHRPMGVLKRHIPAPHPRFYGTFPRVLGRYVREREVISLEEAIRKMTSLPAQILGLRDRGMLIPGNQADILVFDPDTVMDKADYVPREATTLFPEGIMHLIVNGVLTLHDKEHTGAKAGKVLRR
jgi:N-acyl-D-aspartate/D-glutamate deacylase